MIYDYQRPVYDSLRKSATAHRLSQQVSLPVKPRFHRLIIGPTGCGKSHVARKVADELNWSVLNINVSAWIVLGARETPTWHTIMNWLAEEADRPQMIILDELDKVDGEDSWTRYLRAELFALMDGIVPCHSFDIDCDEGESPAAKANLAEKNLKKLLVFGCGAFQHAFEEKPSVGFVSEGKTPTKSADLAKHLQRELINRFDTDVLILPELSKGDYQMMIDGLEPHIPKDAFAIVKELGNKQLDDAVRDRTGARFSENLLAAAFYRLSEGIPVEKYSPPKKETQPEEPETEITQEQIDEAAEQAALWEIPIK